MSRWRYIEEDKAPADYGLAADEFLMETYSENVPEEEAALSIPRLIVSEARDTFSLPTDSVVIDMTGTALSAGLYRLEASVTLKVLPNGPDLKTHPEGTLVQVY